MKTNVVTLFPEPEKAVETRFEEAWRRVPDLPYEASSYGRVRRAEGGRGAVLGRVISPSLDGRGYLSMNVYVGGVRKFTGVHRLVCMAFHGPPPFKGAQAAHCDGDKLNNTPENLRWATPKENSEDTIRHGRTPRGERSPKTKLTSEDVITIRSRIFSAPPRGKRRTIIELAKQYGMSKWSIYELSRSRKNWSWLKEGLPKEKIS